MVGQKTLLSVFLENHYQNAVCGLAGLARTINAVQEWRPRQPICFTAAILQYKVFLVKIQLGSYNQKLNFLKASRSNINLARTKYGMQSATDNYLIHRI